MNLNFTLEQEEEFMTALGYEFEVMGFRWDYEDYRKNDHIAEDKAFIAWKTGEEKPDPKTVNSQRQYDDFYKNHSFRKTFEREFASHLITNLTKIINLNDLTEIPNLYD